MRSKYTVPELYAIGIIKAWSKQQPTDYFDAYDVFNFVKDMLNSDIELDGEFRAFIDRTINRIEGKIYI